MLLLYFKTSQNIHNFINCIFLSAKITKSVRNDNYLMFDELGNNDNDHH